MRRSLHDQLAEELTPDAFAELVAKFGGRRIRVPTAREETRRERAARMVATLGTHSYAETAALVGCSVATAVRTAKRSM